MTDMQIEEIRLRRDAVPDEPWIAVRMTSHKSRRHGSSYYKVVEKANDLGQICHYVPARAIADFIAHAKEDISNLLSEVEITKAELAMTTDAFNTANSLLQRWKERAMELGTAAIKSRALEWHGDVAEIYPSPDKKLHYPYYNLHKSYSPDGHLYIPLFSYRSEGPCSIGHKLSTSSTDIETAKEICQQHFEKFMLCNVDTVDQRYVYQALF